MPICSHLKAPDRLSRYPVRFQSWRLASWCMLLGLGGTIALAWHSLTSMMVPLGIFYFLGLDFAARTRGFGGLSGWMRDQSRRMRIAATFDFQKTFGPDALPAVSQGIARVAENLEDEERPWAAFQKVVLTLLTTALVGCTTWFASLLSAGTPTAVSLYLACLEVIAYSCVIVWLLCIPLRGPVHRLRAERRLLREVELELLARGPQTEIRH
jgi:hypothetical protein